MFASQTDELGPDGAKIARCGRPFRLGLFGAFGCGNFGNDATLEACLTGVLCAVTTAEIVCVASNPTHVTALYGLTAAPIATHPSLAAAHGGAILGTARRLIGEARNLIRAWRLLRRVQNFVIAGTGVLDDQHVRPTQLPLDVFRWSLAARLAGARLVFLSVGAGPIENPWSQLLLRSAARLAHDVSYRDKQSLEYMRTLGRDVHQDRVLPDLAFGGIGPDEFERRHLPRRPRIAIGVIGDVNWQDRPEGYKRYENKLVVLISALSAAGCDVRLLNGDEVDTTTQNALMRRPELRGLSVEIDTAHSFRDVLAALSSCNVLIGSRYHNLVAAVIAGIPAISLGYGPKNIALLEQLGMKQWAHNVDDFDITHVLRQVAEARTMSIPLYRPQLTKYRCIVKRELSSLIDG